jgi:ADP-ribose pyrophosphatase
LPVKGAAVTFKTEHTQTVFEGRVFNVRQDQVLYPDGRRFQMDIVDHRDAVTILPVDSDGQIWFIRQYRHAAGKELIELPAGVAEPGEEMLVCAQRELQEEIGMGAKNMEKIGGFYLAPGYSTEYMHVFLATDLYPSSLPGDESEFLSVEIIDARRALSLAESGQLDDSKSLIALFWARHWLAQFE